MSSVSPFLEDVESPLDQWVAEPFAPEAVGEDWEASDALAAVEPWAETEAGAHPLTRVFPLPGAVIDALSGGLAPLAIGLAVSAGYTDVNQLTNIVFYFRHPELIGRKIESGQRSLADEWVSIRDGIVKPALRSVPQAPQPPPRSATRPESLSSSRLVWPGRSAAELAFMRAVYDKHAARGAGSFVLDLPADALAPIEGHMAQKDAAAAATSMLAAARADLARERPAARIGILSAYRPASRQFTIWQGREPSGRDKGSGFPYYYREAIQKGIVAAGDFSDDAAGKVAKYLGGYIASPGFSNHQDGLAFDFGTGAVGGSLGKLSTKAWFHGWLKENATRFRFHPLATEPWHWTYRAAGQSELEVATEVGEVAGSGVRAGRLEVRSVPMLSSHRGGPPDLILRWNDMARVPDEIDVVVHLHGYWYAGMRLPRDIEPVSGLDLAPIAGTTGTVRSRPTLTVLPRGHDTGVRQTFKRKDGSIAYGYNAMTFPALVARDGLTDLTRLALERFAAAVGGAAPRLGRLILTAHSGGGKALLQLLEQHDPHQVHVFDALYWPPEPLERWARRRIAHDTAGASSGSPDYMATQGGALRVFYQRRTSRGTTPFSKKLQAALAPLLQGELARWYRVEASAYDHFQIPRRYGWRVLADASADVPDASAAAPARQGARELESVGTTFAHDVEDVREAALDEVEEPGEASPEVELEDLAPPPLNALAEPRSRHRPREAEHEHTVASDEHADLDESSAAYLFDEAELEDLDTDDGVGELGTGHEDEVESLLEGVDLYAEAAEPDVAFEQSGVEEWEE